MAAWLLRVANLVLVVVLVLPAVKLVNCEQRPQLLKPVNFSELRRQSRHGPSLPPPPPPRVPFQPGPGLHRYQPRPEDTLALHPRHPLRLYSHRDGPRPGQFPHPELRPGPPHQPGPRLERHHRPGPLPHPGHRPGPPHQPGPRLEPHHRPGPLPGHLYSERRPELHPQSEHRPAFPLQPGHRPKPFHQSGLKLESLHQPDHSQGSTMVSHHSEFSFKHENFSPSYQPSDKDSDLQHVEAKSRPESGCRINGELYGPGQSWFLPDCRRGTCVKFGHNYYVSEDRCSVKYHNANYACVIYQERDRKYPDCCPYYRCNPEN